MYPKDYVKGLQNFDDFQQPIKKVHIEEIEDDTEENDEDTEENEDTGNNEENAEEKEEDTKENEEDTEDSHSDGNASYFERECLHIGKEDGDEAIKEWQAIQFQEAVLDNIINTDRALSSEHRPQTSYYLRREMGNFVKLADNFTTDLQQAWTKLENCRHDEGCRYLFQFGNFDTEKEKSSSLLIYALSIVMSNCQCRICTGNRRVSNA